VLELLLKVKREAFAPPEHRDIAFADLETPDRPRRDDDAAEGRGAASSRSWRWPEENVYEVGTGSGYLTALLASRARHVTSAEIHADLQRPRPENLRSGGYRQRDASRGDSGRATA
jgi:protein-L-isoaspartate(D-aspartate) O-methyltransferase